MPLHPPANVPSSSLELDDLHSLAHLLPQSAAELVRAIGPVAAVALMAALPGVEFAVPKHRGANPAGARKFDRLSEIIGEQAMPALLAAYGGQAIDVPLCLAAIAEKRNRWIRARFDVLTSAAAGSLSKREAVYEIGLELAGNGRVGITYRSIEKAIDSADGALPSPQLDLFPGAAVRRAA